MNNNTEHIAEGLKIRLLTPDDRKILYNFFRQLGDEGSKFFNCNGINERGAYMYLNGERPDRIYWAAVADTAEGEEIAGLVFIWNKNQMIPWLGIGIAENWRGMHLGRRLMDTVREWVESVGGGGICLTTSPGNIRGQRLYDHMGYKHIGTYHNGERLYLLTLPNKNIT